MSDLSDEKLILVPYKKGRRFRRFSILLVFSVMASCAGFFMGQWRVELAYAEALQQRAQLLNSIKLYQKTDMELRQKLANFERGQAIDTEARKNVLQTIQSLESQVSQLKGDVTFYKNIMAPSSGDNLLQIRKVEISPSNNERRFGYKFVLAKVSNNNTYISGVVAVNLIGEIHGKKEIFPLRDISEETELGIKFRFRYFQSIEGDLVLPDAFVPEKVQIVAQSKGKKAVRVEDTFDWRVGETGSDVGKKSG
ncbi:MAG: hypothetical protein MI864_15565 [Pseudomonadales bacterium]|uniref:Membrane or secreted protein n=1 Tax=Oleiphilus messinensis TaxID=141451 RepID=A0A1Y0IGR8_9GAMM|nr:DUF6776 family protein [Oleiphilus messinensis]ARU58725.1 membrane or secreted protein [Oleiphilus messinensis]MCG8611943.1 hypothetical protein [Pseudomonadales bacterium]